MEKLTLTCECGQEMLVPASALGKVGLCPSCGAEVRISRSNTRASEAAPAVERRPGSGLLGRQRAVARRVSEPREEAWRKFATAVDLYGAHRYAEALALLDALLHDYPGNTHIQAARSECLQSLQGVPALPRLYDDHPVPEQTLNAELVKSVVLEKLLHGDDATQLRAAEVAAHILGLCGNGHVSHGTPDALLLRPKEDDGKMPAAEGDGDAAIRAAVREAVAEGLRDALKRGAGRAAVSSAKYTPARKEAPGKSARRADADEIA